MPEAVVFAEDPPLSPVERVTDTFVAPSRTFLDVRRNASWWMPLILLAVASYFLTAAIQTRVGWSQLVDNEIRFNPKMAEKLATVPPEQRGAMRYTFQGSFYAAPLWTLLFTLIAALVLWPTINFGFGGSATFGRVFCVGIYAALPGAISAILAAVMLFAGRSAETFTTQAMLGSNPGYYIDTPGALKTFLTSLDVFTLWTAVLWSLGLAIVARTKRSAGFFAVFGWYVLIVLARTATAAVGS